MKKSIFILLLISILISANFNLSAQCQLTLTELEFASKLNLSEFETFMMNNDFSFSKQRDWPNRTEYLCNYIRKDSSKDEITYTRISNTLFITWLTTNKQYYFDIKDSMEIKGYTFLREEQISKAIGRFYIKDNIQLNLYIVETPGRTLYVEQLRVID